MEKYETWTRSRLELEYDKLAKQDEKLLAMLTKLIRCHDAGDTCLVEFDEAKSTIAEIKVTS